MTFGTPGGLPVSQPARVAERRPDRRLVEQPVGRRPRPGRAQGGSAPTGPTDGTLVYSGSGDGFFDTGLTNGTTYWYAVWIQRAGGDVRGRRSHRRCRRRPPSTR